MFVFLCTSGWAFANLYIFQQTRGVCALGVGGWVGGGNHVYHMSQMLSFCQVAAMVMTVFIWRLGVYANLYIFQLMKGEVLAAAALLPYAGFPLGGLVALVLRMSTSNVVTISVETGKGGGEREIER